MNLYRYQTLAKEYAKEYWGLEFDLPVVSNGRLGRALGRYCYQTNRYTGEITPKKIELAGRIFGNYNEETIESVLKHELCHWALSVQGKPFKDGHPVFEREIKRVGASSTNTITMAGDIYFVKCSCCGKSVVEANTPGRLNKYINGRNAHRYTSKCCKARLEYGGMKYKEDMFGQQEKKVPVAVTIPTPIEKPIAPRPVVQERKVATTQKVITAYKSGLTIDDILIPGRRGVSNAQMIPAMKKAIELNDKTLFLELHSVYPDVFESSKKYLTKKYIPMMEMWLG